MNNLEEWLRAANLDIPTVLKMATVILTPVFSFFNVNILLGLMTFLLVDLLTGLYKAKLLRKLASAKFGKALDRALYYLFVYVVLHVLTLVLPFGSFSSFFETAILTGYLLKEALSILENLRVIRKVQGHETNFIDALILRLGMDLDKITQEIESGKTPTITEAVTKKVELNEEHKGMGEQE
jgi:toxin secretion/phage lysis holin